MGVPVEVKEALIRQVLREPAREMMVKQAAVEGCIRMINCLLIQGEEVSEYMAALILQYFERPESEQVQDPITKKISNRAKYPA
jgi:DNA-binding NarL/FixJ family response regulator